MDSTQQRIAEIAERGRALWAQRMAEQEEAVKRVAAEERQRQQQRIQATGLPEWMHEYLSFRTDDGDWLYTLHLPGCAPVQFGVRIYGGEPGYTRIEVLLPQEIEFDDYSDTWWLRVQRDGFYQTLDEAITVAADNGESYWAMQAEVDNRNVDGIRPEPKPQPAPEPDLLAQAGELLRKYQMTLATPKIDPAVVVTSAVLAVAAELRAVCNALQDGAA